MANQIQKDTPKLSPLLWTAVGILLAGMLTARVIYPEYLWLTIVLAVLLVAALGGLIQQNRKALQSRSAAYGLNTVVTAILVIAIVVVLNFVSNRFPQKLDLTKNKVHTLSEQTVKLVKGLKQPVKATLFAKFQQRQQYRPLLENYKDLNPKFEIEFVDPDKEPTRAKAAGIKKYNTLQLVVGPREDKVEDLTEEKITNALIKLLKEKTSTFCPITGEGERNFSAPDSDPEGYSQAKKALTDQAYAVKEVNLAQEAKIPAECDAIGVMGPTKGFLEPEVKLISDYLANGGRAVIALDPNLKGQENAPELIPVLEAWHVKADRALIIDPISRLLGVDASMPVIFTFSKTNPITRDFEGQKAVFPLVRPLEVVAGAPAGLTVEWIAQSTPKAILVTDFKDLAKGQIEVNPAKSKAGPFSVAVAVNGKQKDSKASKSTRIVVFGSSAFASNRLGRAGVNLDFFMNAASWVLEDESVISIRAKEEGSSRVELSGKQGSFIFLLTVLFIPLAIAITGIVIWAVRRKM